MRSVPLIVRSTVAGLLACAVAAQAQSPNAAGPGAERVAAGSDATVLRTDANLVLVDVRRPDEVTAIGGFPVYLSIQLKDLANSLAWIPKDRTVVLVSNHAGRASHAADLLSGKGFKVAGAIGAQTYEKAGGTILHIPVPPPRVAGTN